MPTVERAWALRSAFARGAAALAAPPGPAPHAEGGRLCANDRGGGAGALRGLHARRLRPRRVRPGDRPQRLQPLALAFGGTDRRGFPTLPAAAVRKGRALPLLRAGYTQGKPARSQNNLGAGCHGCRGA
jgi:hypothetical protein